MTGRRLASSRLVAAVSAIALALLGCAPIAQPATIAPEVSPTFAASPTQRPSPTPLPTQAPARWSDCGGGFQCSTLVVPRNEMDPSAGRFDISLIRLPAAEPDERIGSLVMNPGGPGGSGVEFVRQGADLFSDDLRDRFDLVGFDPRGVNFSSRVRCLDTLDGHFTIDPSPDDVAELDRLVGEAEAFARACQDRNDSALPHLSTNRVVDDLDRIRQALGDDGLTYLGFSYGSLIGALYADRYPDRIRAMVLDGAIDPALDHAAFRGGQAQAFEAALGRLFASCAARTSCLFHEGGKPEAAFDRLMAQIDASPLPVLRGSDRRTVGPGLAHGAVLSALYSEAGWRALEAGLALAKAGDGTILLQMSDPFRGRKPNGTYSNLFDAYTANTCLDFPVPRDVAGFTALGESLAEQAPHFAEFIGYNDLACLFWPVAAERVPGPVRAAGAPPIVVVGSTGDTATPYIWAEALADELASGVLLTREGEGHTGYGFSACIRGAVDAYLLDLTVPDDGKTCR
jgi:pimeloyl-ACP methyl ester carboxylesterase